MYMTMATQHQIHTPRKREPSLDSLPDGDQPASTMNKVARYECENGGPLMPASESLQYHNPSLSSAGLDSGIDIAFIKVVIELILGRTFANFFDFLQHFFMEVKKISVFDFFAEMNLLLSSKDFQNRNFWLQLSPEIPDCLPYALDYLVSNCPGSFYTRGFTRIVIYIEKDVNNPAAFEWIGPRQSPEQLLLWTDKWWSNHGVYYQPARPLPHPYCKSSVPAPQKPQITNKRRFPKTQPRTPSPVNHGSPHYFQSDDIMNNLQTLNTLQDNDSCFGDYIRPESQPLQLHLSQLAPIQTDNLNQAITRFDAPSPLPVVTTTNYLHDSNDVLSYLDRIEEMDERQIFHQMEQARFGSPTSTFTYTLPNGDQSVVGPLFGPGISLFNHVSNFPELEKKLLDYSIKGIDNVYIVDLVRDAVARLPGGYGTRVEICKLFKQSQFVNSAFIVENDCLINGLVGKCLEILSDNEIQACVEFVINHTGRSLWHYISYNDSYSNTGQYYEGDTSSYTNPVGGVSTSIQTGGTSNLISSLVDNSQNTTNSQNGNSTNTTGGYVYPHTSELSDFVTIPSRGRPRKHKHVVRKSEPYSDDEPNPILYLSRKRTNSYTTFIGKKSVEKPGDVIVDTHGSITPTTNIVNIRHKVITVKNRCDETGTGTVRTGKSGKVPVVKTGFSVSGFDPPKDPSGLIGDTSKLIRVVNISKGQFNSASSASSTSCLQTSGEVATTTPTIVLC